jgi:hypothetical protein
VFLSESVALDVCPTLTLPNDRELADATSVPAVVVLLAWIEPQPEKVAARSAAAAARARLVVTLDRSRSRRRVVAVRKGVRADLRVRPAGAARNLGCIYLTSCKTKNCSYIGVSATGRAIESLLPSVVARPRIDRKSCRRTPVSTVQAQGE